MTAFPMYRPTVPGVSNSVPGVSMVSGLVRIKRSN